ncbi:MFS transporter [Streptococcus sp. DD13]|uniref:MFS transporter n=1 Tax=Streptococcus sp. DD13 TaxID=1777881 RepID=UPI0007965905|nr:MFS transporter [Streptococcus sp. DD13]KXT79215.1 lantibiotic efflux protein [Streptococcus sp. DD13]
MKRILTNKLYLTTFIADMISNFGDSLYYLALMNYVLVLPDAQLAIALVTLSESLPLLTRFAMGVWADRTKDKVDTIVATQIFRLVLYLIVGFVMGFSPSLWIVLVAVVVNVFSDLSGQYESYLYIPLSLRIVSDEDREAAAAFRQASSAILQIGFQASGAILIAFMTYPQLAFLNAGTFLASALIMFAIRSSLIRLLEEHPLKMVEHNQSQGLVKELTSSFKDACTAIQKVPALQASIVAIMGINAVGSILQSLVAAMIKDFGDFIIGSPATTLASVSIAFFVGNIIGSILCTNLFKKVSLITMVTVALGFLAIFFVAMVWHHIAFSLLMISGTAVVTGGATPKLSAMLFRELPEEKLASIGSAIDSFLTFGMVLSRVAFSALILWLPVQEISFIYLLLCLGLLGCTIISRRKNQVV